MNYTVTYTQYFTYEVSADNYTDAMGKANKLFNEDMCRLGTRQSYDEVEIECDDE
jgi:hypothetical protein